MFTMVLKDWPDFHSVGFRTRHNRKIRIVPGELGIVCPPSQGKIGFYQQRHCAEEREEAGG